MCQKFEIAKLCCVFGSPCNSEPYTSLPNHCVYKSHHHPQLKLGCIWDEMVWTSVVLSFYDEYISFKLVGTFRLQTHDFLNEGRTDRQ